MSDSGKFLLASIVNEMQLRFTSGNSIPVERASIRKGEWDLILEALPVHAYVCPKCSMRSYNPNDIRYRYCGNCHKYEDEHDRRTEAGSKSP